MEDGFPEIARDRGGAGEREERDHGKGWADERRVEQDRRVYAKGVVLEKKLDGLNYILQAEDPGEETRRRKEVGWPETGLGELLDEDEDEDDSMDDGDDASGSE